MRETSLIVSNYVLFVLLTQLLSGVQCSLWLQIFGPFVAPQLWVPTLVYWTFYRRPHEGLAMTYLLTIALASLTAMPFSLFLMVNLVLFCLGLFVKTRIYWGTSTFFMLMCGAFSLFFPWVHWLFSLMVENNPIQGLSIFDWIMQSLLTTLCSLPLFYLLQKIDDLTQKEIPTEMGASQDEFLP